MVSISIAAPASFRMVRVASMISGPMPSPWATVMGTLVVIGGFSSIGHSAGASLLSYTAADTRAMKKLFVISLLATVLCAEEKVDLGLIQRIKTEAFQNSNVMDHLFWLTDVYGPRLTGSPGFTAAANWTVKRLKDFGIGNAAIQKWGKFGRSWRATKFSISLQEPEYAPLIGFPLAWSADTNGPLIAEPVLAPLTITDGLNFQKTEEELGKFYQEQKGKLHGKIVLLRKPKDVAPVTTA